MIWKTLSLASLLVGTLAVSGCGGDSDRAPVASAGASPSLGVITNARVEIYANDGTTLLQVGDTGPDGVVSGLLTPTTGPIIIRVLGDDVDAMYFDESAGMVPFPSGEVLHAIAPSANGTFAVTPLTELAYRGALANGLLPISAAAVNALNERVRSTFVPYIGDILAPPTPFDSNTTTGSLGDDDAGRYALFLAALAELGSSQSAPALSVLKALIEDLEDGVIDGANDDGPVSTPYTPGSFSTDLAAALATYASGFGSTGLQSAAGEFSSGTTLDFSGITNEGGGGSGCGSDCLTFFASIADTYSGIPDEGAAGNLATEFSGKAYDVVIGSDGTITISGESTEFNFSVSEITNFESTSETNVLYVDEQSIYRVLLQKEGESTFFINIYDPDGTPEDDDQVTLDLSGATEAGSGIPNLNLIQGLAGTYSVTTGVTGGAGTHNRGTVIIDAAGNIDFDTGISFTASTDYETIYDRLFISQDPQIDQGPAVYVSMVFPDNGTDDGDRLDIFFSDGTGTTITAFKYAKVGSKATIVGIAP